MDSAPSLADLARAVDELLPTGAFPDDPPTIFRATARPVRRIGFALTADADLAARVRDQALDAVFLHRPWGAEPLELPVDLGILCSHAAFDARLTLGANPDLAAALGVRNVEPFGEHRGRVAGMIGDARPAYPAEWKARLVAEFGGAEEVVSAPPALIHRVAIMGAMTAALVRAAAEEGAGLYITGQIRAPARRAVAETGITAIAIGHPRSEEHALTLLAQMLAARFPGLHIDLPRPVRPAQPVR